MKYSYRSSALLLTLALAMMMAPPVRAEGARASVIEELQSQIIRTAEKIRPSVVFIRALTAPKNGRVDAPPDLPFPFPQPPQPQRRPGASSGSGIIIRADGYILTNNHVVRNADSVRVVFEVDSDAPQEVPAKVIGYDAEADLAVIKVNRTGLKAATFGDSDKVKVGAWALAVGNPLGETGSVTLGIVSAKGRHLGRGLSQSLYEYIQTDAAINPGNSGGPLCDLEGNVIGINSVILTNSGFNNGIAFSVASNEVKEVLPHLMKGESVPRGFLGVTYKPIDPEVAHGLGLERALVLGDFAPGESPARSAGLQPGDIITELNGKKVTTSDNFRRDVVRLGPGATVHVKALREAEGNMKVVEASVTLGQRPQKMDGEEDEAKPDHAPAPKEQPVSYGLTVDNLTAENAVKVGMTKALRNAVGIDPQAGAVSKPGALIMNVDLFSAASDALLEPGDVITKVKINKEPWREVKNADEFKALVGKPKPGERILLFGKFKALAGAVDYRALVAPSTAK